MPDRRSVIGFAGNKVRGTLGVAASKAGLDALSSSVGAEPDDIAASLDSLGEFANLILGEVKRGWSRRGIDVTISTPQMLRGVEIQVCGSDHLRAPGSEWFAASDDETSTIKVWLDAHAREAIELADEADAGTFADQGDAILF